MSDPQFIDGVIQQGRQARSRVEGALAGMTSEQFNWRPAPGRWSVAECLDHLVISHTEYFDVLKRITEGSFRMHFWERYSPLSSRLGKLMKDQLQAEVKTKMKTSPKLVPKRIVREPGFVETYTQNLDLFLDYIGKCRAVDLDKTIITSPLLSFVTYSLRDAFTFLLTHEHRHINQAVRVKEEPGFPE